MSNKLISLLLATCMLFCLSTCGTTETSSNVNNTQSESQTDTTQNTKENIQTESNISSANKESISGYEIEYASPYSEGLMFLKLIGNDADVYCVDKNGEVAFKLDDTIVNIKSSQFMCEYAFVSATDTSGNYHTVLCDKKGKLTYPSDIGVTEFYGPDEILNAGYILAVKVEANYNYTKKQLGVLNTKLEWKIPLSEELYTQFEDTLTDAYDENFIVDNIFYSVKLSKSLNLETGEVCSVDLKQVTPSSEWGVPKNCEAYYRVKSNMVVPEDGMYIDLRGKNIIVASKFVNGKAGVLYHNKEAEKHFVGMIDEKGTNQFEPSEIMYAPLMFDVVTDGKYLISIEKNTVVSRDQKGNKIGEFSINSLRNAEVEISNGVVTVSGKMDNKNITFCLDSQLNKLF